MDNHEDMTRGQKYIHDYEESIMTLYRYVPYLTERGGKDISQEYDGSLGRSSMSFPVYDGTLLSFVREIQKSALFDRNYVYAYSKRRIRTPEQEEKAVKDAAFADIDMLRAVLSKYAVEGMRKTGVWQDAVERKLFLTAIVKLKEFLDYYK